MQGRAGVFVVVSAMLLPAGAGAQRREGERITTVFGIDLPVCVEFGEVDVPARRYRLTLGPDGFALADPASMVHVATVPVTEQSGQPAVAKPAASVERRGDSVSIVLRYGDRVYTATGTSTTERKRDAGSQVMLARKQETLLERVGPEEQSDRALVERALKRYIGSVEHCADGAQRGRWETNDPRFVKCVCPIMEKWRLPRVDKPLRIHHPLVKGRSGFSLTATPEGRAIDCKVWIGASSPEQQEAAPSPATKGAKPGTTSEAAPAPRAP